jgi:hypothetical protein
MAYVDDKAAQAKALVGKRVQIPVHYDMWMCGARYGVVTSIGGTNTHSPFVRVKLDHPQVKRRLKVWQMDYDYMQVLDS